MNLIEFPGRKIKNQGEATKELQEHSFEPVDSEECSWGKDDLEQMLEDVGQWIDHEAPQIPTDELDQVDLIAFSQYIKEFPCMKGICQPVDILRIVRRYNAQSLSSSQEVALELVLSLLNPDLTCFDLPDAFSVLGKADRLAVLRILDRFESTF